MADWLAVQLLREQFTSTGNRRTAASALLRCVRKGTELSGKRDRVLSELESDLGREVADHARDICSKLGVSR